MQQKELFSYHGNEGENKKGGNVNYTKLILISCLYSAQAQSMIKTVDQIPALSHKEMMLFNYVRLGYIKKTMQLLHERVSVNIQDTLGYTPVMIASFYDDVAMLQKLFEWGADGNIQNIYGHTALMLAAYYGRFKIIKILLQQKNIATDLKGLEGNTALEFALISPYDKDGIIAAHLLNHKKNTPEEEAKAPAQTDS